MTPLKSQSRRRFEADISGCLCCDAGAADFNGRCVKSVRTDASGQERTVLSGSFRITATTQGNTVEDCPSVEKRKTDHPRGLLSTPPCVTPSV